MPNNWNLYRPGVLGSFYVLLAMPAALYNALANYPAFAGATSVRHQPTSNMTLSNGNNANRDNGFQILADGTQDLAALVGLFATDGVERYTIDYTRGFLPPVTAPLSLLGLLGYVRALLKLSVGIEFCERTGFSTTSLRSYAGVRACDVPQNERVIEVRYLERTITESSVEWKIVKTASHTQESMPLIVGGGKRALRDRRAYDPSFSTHNVWAVSDPHRKPPQRYDSIVRCSVDLGAVLCVRRSAGVGPHRRLAMVLGVHH